LEWGGKAARTRTSQDPARGSGAAGGVLSSVRNRAPVLALLFAKNGEISAKIAPCSRHSRALVCDRALVVAASRSRATISFRRVSGRFFWADLLAPSPKRLIYTLLNCYNTKWQKWGPFSSAGRPRPGLGIGGKSRKIKKFNRFASPAKKIRGFPRNFEGFWKQILSKSFIQAGWDSAGDLADVSQADKSHSRPMTHNPKHVDTGTLVLFFSTFTIGPLKVDPRPLYVGTHLKQIFSMSSSVHSFGHQNSRRSIYGPAHQHSRRGIHGPGPF